MQTTEGVSTELTLTHAKNEIFYANFRKNVNFTDEQLTEILKGSNILIKKRSTKVYICIYTNIYNHYMYMCIYIYIYI
jgi:hypothetical protein